MNIHNLQYFCSVAKHLNFSKAAEECHIAQTAMSRSIAAMEDELGFRLFDRTRHHVELTPAGAYFLKEAAQIVEQYNFSLQSGREISRSSSTRLDIGFGGYDMNFARFYVSRFMRLHPECSIVLREYHYDKIFGSLLSRTCDVIFTAQTRIEDEAAVRQVLVSHSNYIVGVGLCHPLSQYDTITPDQLNGIRFICPVDINGSWEQARPPQPPVYPLRHQTRSHHSYQFRHCRYYHAGFGHGRYLSHRGHRASQPKCQKNPPPVRTARHQMSCCRQPHSI